MACIATVFGSRFQTGIAMELYISSIRSTKSASDYTTYTYSFVIAERI